MSAASVPPPLPSGPRPDISTPTSASSSTPTSTTTISRPPPPPPPPFRKTGGSGDVPAAATANPSVAATTPSSASVSASLAATPTSNTLSSVNELSKDFSGVSMQQAGILAVPTYLISPATSPSSATLPVAPAPSPASAAPSPAHSTLLASSSATSSTSVVPPALPARPPAVPPRPSAITPQSAASSSAAPAAASSSTSAAASSSSATASSEDPEETGYVAPKQVSVDELMKKDADDASLARYKAQLLASSTQQAKDPNDPRHVIIESVELIPIGEVGVAPIQIDLTPFGKNRPFILKEGTSFKLCIKFYVQHAIVSGLVFTTQTYKMKIKVDSTREVLGSYAPSDKLITVMLPEQDLPSGFLSRGSYTASAQIKDDDKRVHLDLEYSFELKKSWA